MILKVNSETELRLLERSDAEIIFNTIDQERLYPGKWFPFVASTNKVS